MARAVFVAPHYDDVALSCGGTVALRTRSTTSLIVTVFGGQPGSIESEFARFQHERWGFQKNNAIEQRRAEDACAARAMGSSVETRWLDYLDAIYRNPAYDSDSALFGDVLDGDAALGGNIADALVDIGADEYYVPLALGNHVDHQIVRTAGQTLARTGRTVWAYQDMPYALSLTPVEINAALPSAEHRLVVLDEDALDRKLAAVACYRSQTPVIFRHFGAPDEELRRFTLRTGAGRPAEAFYRIPG